MFVKVNSVIINTDFICAIAKGGILATKEEPYVIHFGNEKNMTLNEYSYKKIIDLLDYTELK